MDNFFSACKKSITFHNFSFLNILPLFINSLPTGSSPYRDSATLFGIGFLSVFYVIIAAIFFFLSVFLFHFGVKMKKALQYTDQELFNDSLLNLKRYYRVMGIITIIYLSFLALTLLFGLIGLLFTM